MKHFFKFSAGIFLFFMYLLIACHDEELKPVVDYRCQIEMSSPVRGKIFANTPIPVDLTIRKNDPDAGTYSFSYQIVEGTGDVLVNGKKLRPGETMNVDIDKLSLSFIPLRIGEHKLKFRFENEEYFTEAAYLLKANDLVFEAKAENLPEKILINKTASFDLNVVQKDTNNLKEFDARIAVLKGKGYVAFVGDNNDTILYSRALTPSDSISTRAGEDDNTFRIRIGKNKLHYRSEEEGENIILLQIENEYGYSQDVSVPLNVELPQFSVKTNADTSAAVGTTNNFLLTILDQDNYGENTYNVTYRNLKNSGICKINNNEVQVGSVLQLQKGANVCEFTPNELGPVELEFIVKDKYNTTQKDTVRFTARRSYVNIELSDYDTTATVYDTRNLSFSVNKKNYKGKYYFNLVQSPLNAASIKINGADYMGGKTRISNPENTLISFVPQKLGELTLDLKVYDDYDSETIQKLKFTISNSPAKIIISNHKPSLSLLAETSFNFAIEKPKYSGKFKCEIIQNNETSVPGDYGTLLINGKEYTGGQFDISNPANTLVSFIPSHVGKVNLRVKVYDDFGGEISENLIFSVSNTETKISVANYQKDIVLGQETTFNLSVTKPYFNDKLFTYSITTQPEYAGSITVDGQAYGAGLSIIKNNVPVSVGFVPAMEGNVNFIIKVSDDFGGETSYPLSYSVSNPDIRIETMNFSSSALINTENIFNISVNKEHYKGSFKCNIETVPANTGRISVNDEAYTGGLLPMTKPADTKISFTPSADGNIFLKLTVTDELGSKAIKEYEYKVTNPQLQLSLGNVEDDLTLNKKSSFSFSVQKPGYTGKFFAEIEAENAGGLKVANAPYTGGERVEITNPSGTYVSFIPQRVGQDTVKLKISVFDEWGGQDKKDLTFSVNNSNLQLDVTNVETNLFTGRETSFNFTASKADYTGKLKYEIRTTPVNMGTFLIGGKDYISGQMEFRADETVPVIFTPQKEGSVNFKIIITDDFGGEKSKTFTSVISSPEIQMEVTDFISQVPLKTENIFNISVSKEYYKGDFNYSITTTPLSAGIIKVNDTEYKGGRLPLTSPKNTKISFTPSIAGDVIFNINITDNAEGKLTRTLNYNVINNPVSLIVSNQETGLTINKETSFNFAVSKKDYSGKYQFEITTDPVAAGTFKVNGKEYTGGRTEITTPTNTKVQFTPSVVGEVKMLVKVYDEQEGSAEKELPFSIKNSEFNIIVSNQTAEILHKVATNFNFGVLKPNYSGSYQIEILQTPENSGTIKLNGTAYNGGKIPLTNPALSAVEYTSASDGQNMLTLKVYDELGGLAEKNVIFTTLNPEIELSVTNHNPDILVNASSGFNFTVTKENYEGGFKAQIEQIPAGKGTIKLNSNDYNGTEIALSDPSNLVTFIPSETGNVILRLTVRDEWGKKQSRDIPFSVANTDIAVNVTGKEYGLILNKATTLNFSVSKPNYSGSFSARIKSDPEDAGTIKLNSSVYSGMPAGIGANNTIEFLPAKTGAVMLTLAVSDELGGEKEIPLNFNIVNPAIEIAVSNKENNISYNTTTSFNAAVSKNSYSGNFTYEIIQEPAASGTLKVDNRDYSGGIAAVTDPRNLYVTYLPKREGYVTLRLKVYDQTGGSTEKILSYTVTNPPVELTLNTGNTSLAVGSQSSFTMKATKTGYSGKFTYEITPVPVDCGTVSVNGSLSSTGPVSPNPSAVVFTPAKTGTAVLNVKVSDSYGKTAEKQVVYNVSNTPIEITFPNYSASCILNNPVPFIFKATKANYADSKKLTYTINPTTSGKITVSGNNYDGTGKEVTYNAIKNGLPVTFTPNREGESNLTFTVTDEFGTTESKTIKFTVANPELSLFLAGVNTGGVNETSLGQTYKFTYNVSKANYNDDFSYWITLEPSAAGVIGTSDITPRTMALRSGGGVQTETGTIKNNPSGVATGEVRLTVSNPDYVGQNVKVKIVVRDKWNNEKSQEVTFRTVTSALAINVTRKNSIPVADPYAFFFTVSKPGYSGSFKYQIIGWNDGDKLEVSADNNNWSVYAGGKFTLPNPDHTYLRYTPAKVGTVPLRLFVYDDLNGEAMQEMTFDVKAPVVKLVTDATSKPGYTNEFVPFQLTGTDEKGEELSATFTVDNTGALGEMKFNGSAITPTSRIARAAGTVVKIASGAQNKLELEARQPGTWSATTTATNRWGSSASVTTAIVVTELPDFELVTSKVGQGEINGNDKSRYKSGTVVTLTATPATGWKFVRWEGDASGTTATTTITMNSKKNVIAVFEEDNYILTTETTGEGSITVSPNQAGYQAGTVVTLTAIPAAGWEFAGWEGNASGTTATTTVTMNSDKKVKAKFTTPPVERKFRFTVYTQSSTVKGGISVYLEDVKVPVGTLKNIVITANQNNSVYEKDATFDIYKDGSYMLYMNMDLRVEDNSGISNQTPLCFEKIIIESPDGTQTELNNVKGQIKAYRNGIIISDEFFGKDLSEENINEVIVRVYLQEK